MRGKGLEAIAFYDRAIAFAEEHQYIHEAALANELAAKCCLAQGQQKFAQLYLTDAYYNYAHWGAKAKLDDLEAKYPQLLEAIGNKSRKRPAVTESAKTESANSHSNNNTAPTREVSTALTVTDLSVSSLDLGSVIKASQALSGKIQLEQLLSNLVTVAVENAGAQ